MLPRQALCIIPRDNFITNICASGFLNLNFNISFLIPIKLPLATLIPALSRLAKLQYLWLYIGRDQLDYELGKMNGASLPILNPVKVLYLEIFGLNVDQFYHHISSIFPNLERLTFKCLEYSQDEQVYLEQSLRKHFKNLEKYKLVFA